MWQPSVKHELSLGKAEKCKKETQDYSVLNVFSIRKGEGEKLSGLQDCLYH